MPKNPPNPMKTKPKNEAIGFVIVWLVLILFFTLVFAYALHGATNGPPTPPMPTISQQTKIALAIIKTQTDKNSEPYRLSSWYLKGIIEPNYYGIAISNIYSAQQLSNIISTANSQPIKAIAATIAITNGFKFSNQLTARRIGIGQVEVVGGITNGWNIVDSVPTNNYYPAYVIQTSTNSDGPFTNYMIFPPGSPGFTNNLSSMSDKRFYRVVYAQ